MGKCFWTRLAPGARGDLLGVLFLILAVALLLVGTRAVDLHPHWVAQRVWMP